MVTERLDSPLHEAQQAVADFGKALGESLLPAVRNMAQAMAPVIWAHRNAMARLAEPRLNDLRDAGLVM